MLDFKGKTVFVSGGTSGINLAIAAAFGEAGASVFVISRNSDKVAVAVEHIRSSGACAEGASADVRDAEAVWTALQTCDAVFGSTDVLISGAAGNFPARANHISSNGFRAVMEIGVLGTHHLLTGAWPHLSKPGASVINVSAPQAFVAMTGQSHVCAAKAGVDMLTRVLAMEWGPAGVRVNSVVPGLIAGTEGIARLAPTDEATGSVIESVPLRRLGDKRDVANLCLFLGSEMASYLSGAVIPVDGAWSLNIAGAFMDPALDAIDKSRTD